MSSHLPELHEEIPDYAGLMNPERIAEKSDIFLFPMTVLALDGTLLKLLQFIGEINMYDEFDMDEAVINPIIYDDEFMKTIETLKAEFDKTFEEVKKSQMFAEQILYKKDPITNKFMFDNLHFIEFTKNIKKANQIAHDFEFYINKIETKINKSKYV